MRRLGKCDGCRQRKVKCDEKKPLCGGCQKGGRPCNYAYSVGRGFALVMQDPSRMTRYGRSIAASAVYPLDSTPTIEEPTTPNSTSVSSADPRGTPTPEPPDLHLRGGIVAADGRGMFQTLAPGNLKPTRPSKRVEAHQRKRCQEHLLRLNRSMSLSLHQPSAPESRLAALFIEMLRPDSPKHQQLFTLGDWLSSIPARVGSSAVVTMAAEFLLHSSEFHSEGSHSRKIQALQTKSKALKALQISFLASHQAPTYDLILATKMHYASEVLLGVTNLHYAVHTLGLMDLLKFGVVPGADEENFWNILDNTYIDDVTMAMTAGRPSIYDNDIYLSSTHPTVLSRLALNNRQFITRAIMHVIIQCPRLIVAIRRAICNSGDVTAIASAISLAERLWHLARQKHFVEYIDASMRTVENLDDHVVRDILVYGIQFDTSQNMVVSTRFWLLQVLLCGTLDTLHRRFPAEYSLSLLPDPVAFHAVDVSAAMQLGRVVLVLGSNPSPLTLIRTHGPFSGSIGAWHRQIRYLHMHSSSGQSVPGHATEGDIPTAMRMKKWTLANCNTILRALKINRVDEEAWMEALDCMAGEELVDWIPSKVSIGAEDGEMVMKLEYSDRTANGDPRAHNGPPRVIHVHNPAQFGPQHLREWMKGTGGSNVAIGKSPTACVVETASPYL